MPTSRFNPFPIGPATTATSAPKETLGRVKASTAFRVLSTKTAS